MGLAAAFAAFTATVIAVNAPNAFPTTPVGDLTGFPVVTSAPPGPTTLPPASLAGGGAPGALGAVVALPAAGVGAGAGAGARPSAAPTPATPAAKPGNPS